MISIIMWWFNFTEKWRFKICLLHVDDREPLKHGRFLENIKGKLCADKGHIGQALFENLFLNDIQLVTKVKNSMKKSLMSIANKILLRKQALIETVNDELKNIAQIEYSGTDPSTILLQTHCRLLLLWEESRHWCKLYQWRTIGDFLILYRTHVI